MMYIVLTYDISSKRSAKVRKCCGAYLDHVQKSVFEGEISLNRLNALKNVIAKNIDPQKDSVLIFRTESSSGMSFESIGVTVRKASVNF